MREARESESSPKRQKNRPRKVTVTGALMVRRGSDGQVSSAKLATPGGELYYVFLDERGHQLVREMQVPGTRVAVAGHVTEEDGESFLAVRRFRKAGEAQSASLGA